MKYYEAGPGVVKKILPLIEQEREAQRAQNAFKRTVGAVNLVFDSGRVIGCIFKEKPDTADWVSKKPGFWAPRAGTPLHDAMEQLPAVDVAAAVRKAARLPGMISAGGLSFLTCEPEYRYVPARGVSEARLLIALRDEFRILNSRGFTRVPDVEVESHFQSR